jgi:uncharacterized protein (TIGR00369 family)
MSSFTLPDAKTLTGYMPHAVRLGLEVTKEGGKHLIMKLPHSDDLEIMAGAGYMAHGAIAALVDTAFGLVTFNQFDEMRRIVTLDIRIDYMGTASSGEDIYAEVFCTKITREVVFVKGDIYCEGGGIFARAVAAFSHSPIEDMSGLAKAAEEIDQKNTKPKEGRIADDFRTA